MSVERITRQCTIDVGSGFRRRVENGDLCLFSEGRTVWIALYESQFREPERSVNELYAPTVEPEEEWESRQAGRFARGYLVREVEKGRTVWTLTTLTASSRHLALASFTFVSEGHLDWAVRSWDSLRLGRR
ncbi:MAG: hypothetical protein IT452_14815 [Planctomycetia bacterium]|nr:hypothetical protein [Planctomycetia bacterium]